jgi:AraC-like DNA-binding protein
MPPARHASPRGVSARGAGSPASGGAPPARAAEVPAPRIFVPPSGHPLRPWVRMIFWMRADGHYARETVLPRVTASLLFNLGDAIRGAGSTGPDSVILDGTRLNGVRMSPFTVHPAGRVDLVGVSLKAEAWAPLLGLPAAELTDTSVDGSCVFPEADRLRERLAEAVSFEQQCAIALRWVAHRLAASEAATPGASALGWACRALRAGAQQGRVAERLGVSSRHLHRMFAARVGVGPAAYVRLRRFTDALGLIRSESTLSRVAHAAGYFDQAHFCRDFKAFTGMTPQAYLSIMGPVPGNLFTT